MLCPNCATDNEPGMNSCKRCGTPLNMQNNNINYEMNSNNGNRNSNMDLSSMYSSGGMNSNNMQPTNNGGYFDNGINTGNMQQNNGGYIDNGINTGNMQPTNNGISSNNMNSNAYPNNNIYNDMNQNNNMQYNNMYQNNNYNNNYQNNNYDNVNYIKNQQLLEKQKKNGIISLIIGILSIVLIYFINILTLPIAIIGLIFGIKAKSKGIAGIILNMITILITTVILVFAGSLASKLLHYGTYTCTSVEEEGLVNEFGHSMELKIERNLEFSINADNNYGLTAIDGTYDIRRADTTKESIKYDILFQTNHRVVEDISYNNEYVNQYTLEVGVDNATLISSQLDSKYICKKK